MRDRLLWILSLLFVAWMAWSETSFQYFDQSLADELALSSADVAVVGGAFLLPYGLVQIPVGWVLDRGRAERWLLLGAITATALTLAFARAETLDGLIISGAGMGLACAVAFPASGLLARRTLPPQRFALAMGATDSLLGFGAALAAVMPVLIHLGSWRQQVTLQIMVLALLVATPLVVVVVATSRQSHAKTSQSISEHQVTDHSGCWSADAIKKLVHAALIYAWGAGTLFGFCQYGLLSEVEGWSGSLKVGVGMVLSLFTSVGMLGAGWLGSHQSRRAPILLAGSCSAAAALLVLVATNPQSVIVLILAGAILGLGLGTSVLAFPLAEAAAPPAQTALVVAFVNTAGTLMGALMIMLSGVLLQVSTPGNTTLVVLTYGSLALLGIILAALLQINTIKRSAQFLS
ncbi:MAG: MFS transporter [Cyanobacteriota bacterium]|nr:MFS transporter [Cyanobacteriota bacterium]